MVSSDYIETWHLPMGSLAGIPDTVRRLRRGLRDVRDTMARCWSRRRAVCLAGMAGGDGTALVLISHQGVDRCEVLDALCRRWPEVVVKSLGKRNRPWR
jgi:hypothetical protein